MSVLTHHDVFGDGLQHHFLVQVFHQQETGEVLKDELLKARKLLERVDTGDAGYYKHEPKQMHASSEMP